METYHRVVYSSRFEILPCNEHQLEDLGGPNDVLAHVEGEPFIIEVPTEHIHLLQSEEVMERLQEQTGCWHICFRPQSIFGSKSVRASH